MFGIDDAAAATLAVGGLGFLGQQDTNSANQANAQAQMDFQANMSNTAYQRQVKDMEAAGLNPMLAYMKGGGASTPSGAMATYQSPVGSAASAATSASVPQSIRQSKSSEVQSYSSASQADANVKLIDTTVEKVKEEIKNIPEEGRRLRAIYINLAEQSAKLAQETQSETIRQKVLTQTVHQLRNDNIITDADIKAIRDTNGIGRIAREIKPGVDIGGDLIGGVVDRIIGRSTTTIRETPWGNSKSTTIRK
jgi:hypothetical protein